MECQETIDLWNEKIIKALPGIPTNIYKDYLPQTLVNDDAIFNRNNPFMAKIIVRRYIINFDGKVNGLAVIPLNPTGMIMHSSWILCMRRLEILNVA